MDINSFQNIWDNIAKKYHFGKDYYKEFTTMNPHQKMFFVGNYCLLRLAREEGQMASFCKNKETWASANKKEVARSVATIFICLVRVAQEFKMTSRTIFDVVNSKMSRAKVANLPEIRDLMLSIQSSQGNLAEAILLCEKVGLMTSMSNITFETEKNIELYQLVIKTLFMNLMCIVSEFEFISVNDFLRQVVPKEVEKIDLSPYIYL